jgi:hypothetical protein
MEVKNLGRPKKDFSKELFEDLCQIQCTKDEISSVFRCSDSTISRWCQREYGETFEDTYKKASAGGKISLRRIQFRLAEKNTGMAIWLGKQYLAQSDKQEISNIVPDTDIKFEFVSRTIEKDVT